MARKINENEAVRFTGFTNELALLSKKYGIVIQSTGGVTFGNFTEVEYVNDYTSGDLDISKCTEAPSKLEPKHYYSWGNEPFGHVSTGLYINDEWCECGTMKYEEALAKCLTFSNPFN